MEKAPTSKWYANLDDRYALVAVTPKTETLVIASVFYVNDRGTPDLKSFILHKDEAVEACKAWIVANLGPIRNFENGNSD